ncbi:hypothetical protein [Fredinandcohnia sp. 179-A 10B2 NHS]|uniref:hypothetical protein n=1 Tax=Fredinandcohnia sp. 179-A 10B2 NHS TaxID=3235176 RepID=UPI0039A36FA8
MSLKLVELQVAIPRSQDAGKLSEQMSMRGQHMQDYISSELEKTEKKKRNQVTEKNELDFVDIPKESPQNTTVLKKQKNKEVKDETQNERHPFKGNFIDIIG